MARAILNLPGNLWRMWRAVGRAEVVHAGVAGWPLPIGWVAAPLARLRRRFLIMNMESSHWRLRPEERARASWRRRLRADLTEWMARRVIRMADFPMFTQEDYRRSMLPPSRAATAAVLPASWILGEDVLGTPEAEAIWTRRNAHPEQPLRLVCASKLTVTKGLLVLFEALRRVAERGVPVALDVYGAGELAEECGRLAAAIPAPVVVRMQGMVPYGAPFFRTLHEYQLLVSPLLSDEQPRIAFDAFSQALPVLGSDTPGHRQCVRPGVDGELVPTGDPDALARAIVDLAGDRERLRRYGLAALEAARGWTHRAMHERRWRLLDAALATRPARPKG
jgi:glycosyltransferase involved in cell wall biosynthesis